MKVRSINLYKQQSFYALQPDASISNKVFSSIIDAPSVKKFAKKYDARIGIEKIISTNNYNETNLGLALYDIKPISIVEKMKNFIKDIKVHQILLKTHANNEDDFIASIHSKNSKCLLTLYKSAK